MRKVVALLLAASLLWPAAQVASAAEALTMSVRAGFDGLVRVGTWLPVDLEISNRGADVSGELQLQVDGSGDKGNTSSPPVVNATPAVLPRYSSKRFSLEIYVPSIANHVTARLVSNGNVLVQRDVPLETVPSGELLCGVISRNAALDFLPTVPLTARQRNVRLAHLDLSDLPAHPQTLASLDCLVMSNLPSGAPTQEQMSGLQSWVAAGGLLVVTGGQSWQKTAADLPAGLLPVKITGSAPLQSLDALAEFSGQKIEDPGPWLASQGTVTDGAVMIQENDVPILVAARRGAGAVFYLALDPATEPLRSWSGSEYLWRYILSNAPAAAASPNVASRQYSGWGRVPRQALVDISGLQPETGKQWALVMLGYGLVLIPASYLAARRRRRRELGAAVAFLVIGAALAASFAWANVNREADVVVNKITLVRAWDDSAPAQAYSYVSVFSLEASQHDVALPRDALIQSLYYPFPHESSAKDPPWSLTVARGQAPTVRQLDLPEKGVGTMAVDSQLENVAVSGDLLVTGQHIAGTIVNRSDHTLQDAALVVGGQVAKLGTLAPGQSRAVDFDLADDAPVTYLNATDVVQQLGGPLSPADSSVDSSVRDIVDSALNASYTYYARVDLSAVTLIAWLSDSPLPVEVRGAKVDDLQRTMLVATLPARLAPGEYSQIPADLIERRPMSVSTGSKLDGNTLTLAPGDSASTEYTLPVQANQFAVDHLAILVDGTLNGQSDAAAAQALGSASVFDWQKADWTDVSLNIGENDLPDPQRFVSPLGTVRVRYTFRPPSGRDMNRFEVTKFDIAVGGHTR